MDDRGTSDRSDASFSGADWVMISAAGERVADMRDMNDESFKGVSQRRNRTVGIPVVISRTAAGMDLRQVDPISLYSAVKIYYCSCTGSHSSYIPRDLTARRSHRITSELVIEMQ